MSYQYRSQWFDSLSYPMNIQKSHHSIMSSRLSLPTTATTTPKTLPLTTTTALERNDDDNNNNHHNSPSNKNKKKNNYLYSSLRDLSLHIVSCFFLASALCQYEDFDCSNLKPTAASLRPAATRGLGFGEKDRLVLGKKMATTTITPDNKNDDNNSKVISLRNVPSYNEIMLQHRRDNIPQWRREQKQQQQQQLVQQQEQYRDDTRLSSALENVIKAVFALENLKAMSQEYMWDDMRELLSSDVLNEDLNQACHVLRNGLRSVDGRTEIGFDWGSCAWRHCGALADAQESIAELRNSLGLFEPYECLFCIDIIERSLRDIIAVSRHPPTSLYPNDDKAIVVGGKTLSEYRMYKPQNEGMTNSDERLSDSSIDVDFFATLQKMRDKIYE